MLIAGRTPPTPSPAKVTVDYAAIEGTIEEKISSGSASLDSIQGVSVSVDGQTVITHYRNGFSSAKTEHMWSVTKSVVATLIGIAISDGLIENLDQSLGGLLPEYRKVMAPGISAITLRQLMSMTGGVDEHDLPAKTVKDLYATKGDLVMYILRSDLIADPGTEFHYSNTGSHLVVAVLAAALQHAGRDQSVLSYARQKLFDPLGSRLSLPTSGHPDWKPQPIPSIAPDLGGRLTRGESNLARSGCGSLCPTWSRPPRGTPLL